MATAPARKWGIRPGVTPGGERHEPALGEGHQTRKDRRINGSMARRSNLRDDFTTVRDQHALSSTRMAEILAEPVLQLADANGLHGLNVAS